MLCFACGVGFGVELGGVGDFVFGTLFGGVRRFGGKSRKRRLRRGVGFCFKTSGASFSFVFWDPCCFGCSCWLSEVQLASTSSEGLYSDPDDFSGVGRFREMFAAALSSSSSEKSFGRISCAITASDSETESVRWATMGGTNSEFFGTDLEFSAIGRKMGDGGRAFGHVFL